MFSCLCSIQTACARELVLEVHADLNSADNELPEQGEWQTAFRVREQAGAFERSIAGDSFAGKEADEQVSQGQGRDCNVRIWVVTNHRRVETLVLKGGLGDSGGWVGRGVKMGPAGTDMLSRKGRTRRNEKTR
jgi:hypothetical protein